MQPSGQRALPPFLILSWAGSLDPVLDPGLLVLNSGRSEPQPVSRGGDAPTAQLSATLMPCFFNFAYSALRDSDRT